MIRNIIFDWSGTLVDDLPAVWKASNFVLTQAGKAEMSLDRFREEFRLPFTTFYDEHVPDVPMTLLEGWFHEGFRREQATVCALPHAREFLGFCREHFMRTYVLSTVHPDYWEAQAKATGFGAFIDRAYTGVWDKRQRIHEMLAQHELDPGETLFIGDMEHDIETARLGGVHSAAVLTGYNTLTQLRRAEPDLIVEHLRELQEILLQNNLALRPPVSGFEERHPPVVTVGGLIFDGEGRVLMVRTHKWSNLWGIPGGKIKWGEPSEDALRRELKEETNLEVSDIRFVLIQDCIHSREFYRDAHFVLLNYTCRAHAPGQVVLNEEAQEFQWLKPVEAKRLALNRPTQVLIDAVLARSDSKEV